MLTLLELLPLLIVALIFVILLTVLWRMRDVAAAEPVNDGNVGAIADTVQGGSAQDGARRRRGGLARMRAAVDQGGAGSVDNVANAEGEGIAGDGAEELTSNVGRVKAKKDANREAKRAAREEHEARLAAQRERLEKAEDARLAAKEAEEMEARETEERARAEAEEKEKKEAEEYSQWKDLISVEETGDEGDGAREEDPAMLERFVSYIKRSKIVVLEELAAEFELKTEDAIQRLTALEDNGTLTGVFDDRGKFIYVSREEMSDVADFITRRGRVSIAELAAESTKLLHLEDAAVAL